MRDINIQINKARISSFHVYLKDNLPRVSATIELLTIAGMKIVAWPAIESITKEIGDL